MSADNWATCPKCHSKEIAEIEQARWDVDLKYGQVSAEEYLRLLGLSRKEPICNWTLREDYELGVNWDGDFYVEYKCSCSACDFHYKYMHRANALSEEE